MPAYYTKTREEHPVYHSTVACEDVQNIDPNNFEDGARAGGSPALCRVRQDRGEESKMIWKLNSLALLGGRSHKLTDAHPQPPVHYSVTSDALVVQTFRCTGRI